MKIDKKTADEMLEELGFYCRTKYITNSLITYRTAIEERTYSNQNTGKELVIYSYKEIDICLRKDWESYGYRLAIAKYKLDEYGERTNVPYSYPAVSPELHQALTQKLLELGLIT